jgi:hypothetical protein
VPAQQPIHGEGDYVVDVSLSSQELVYGLINHDNDTDYTSLTLRLGTPTVNTNTQHDRNTRIYAETRPGAPKQGSTYFYYDRISLAYYLQNYPDLTVDLTDDMTTMQDLIPWFNNKFGLGLVAADVRADKISRVPNAQNRFTISSGSLAWQDSIAFKVTLEPVDISTLTGNDVFDAIHVVQEHPRTYGQMYGYAVPTSALNATLKGLPIGALSDTSGQNLASGLSTATEDYWAFSDAPSVRNLREGAVRFNGLPADQDEYPVREGFNRMVIVDIAVEKCLEFESPLVLYYVA